MVKVDTVAIAVQALGWEAQKVLLERGKQPITLSDPNSSIRRTDTPD